MDHLNILVLLRVILEDSV